MTSTRSLIDNAHRLLDHANTTRTEHDKATALTALANATAQDRIATALDRIATALESLAAEETTAGVNLQAAIGHSV